MKSITTLILNILPELRPSERSVAELILNNPRRASSYTISEISKAAFTSKTTVMRFSHRIGLSGYAQLRYLLAMEAGQRLSHDWQLSDKGADALSQNSKKLAQLQIETIRDTFNMTSMESLEKVITNLLQADRVHIYSPPMSEVVASFMNHVLSETHIKSEPYSDYESAIDAASGLTSDDAAVAICNADETRQLLMTLRRAQKAGAKTIALTTSFSSPLAKSADEVLASAAANEADVFGGSTQLGQIALINCIRSGIRMLQAADEEF